jgi:hypothetical protein
MRKKNAAAAALARRHIIVGVVLLTPCGRQPGLT